MSNILLNDGNNEVELIIFKVGNNHFGINVAKVERLIQWTEPTKMPMSRPEILGVFNERGAIIPLISLKKVLNIDVQTEEESKILITNFNQVHIGFEVFGNTAIVRTAWDKIEKLPELEENSKDDTLMGFYKHLDGEKTLIVGILNLESIVGEMSPKLSMKSAKVIEKAKRTDIKILFVDDNRLTRANVTDYLKHVGFTNVSVAVDGSEALGMLSGVNSFDLLITDIEMPVMDGLVLSKQLRQSNSVNKNVKIIVFSSLINDDKISKCKNIGVDKWISKPELENLNVIINEIFGDLT